MEVNEFVDFCALIHKENIKKNKCKIIDELYFLSRDKSSNNNFYPYLETFFSDLIEDKLTDNIYKGMYYLTLYTAETPIKGTQEYTQNIRYINLVFHKKQSVMGDNFNEILKRKFGKERAVLLKIKNNFSNNKDKIVDLYSTFFSLSKEIDIKEIEFLYNIIVYFKARSIMFDNVVFEDNLEFEFKKHETFLHSKRNRVFRYGSYVLHISWIIIASIFLISKLKFLKVIFTEVIIEKISKFQMLLITKAPLFQEIMFIGILIFGAFVFWAFMKRIVHFIDQQVGGMFEGLNILLIELSGLLFVLYPIFKKSYIKNSLTSFFVFFIVSFFLSVLLINITGYKHPFITIFKKRGKHTLISRYNKINSREECKTKISFSVPVILSLLGLFLFVYLIGGVWKYFFDGLNGLFVLILIVEFSLINIVRVLNIRYRGIIN